MTRNDLKFYKIKVSEYGNLSIKYSAKSKYKNEEIESPIRDFLLDQTNIIDFGNQHQTTEILQEILNDILKDENKLINFIKKLEEDK